MMPSVWAEIIGGDALGHGQEPALCWWLPEGASVQHAYRLRTDDGFDTGRVDSRVQSFVRLPVFDRSRRSATARVKVWTDLGESEWSDPVGLEAGLLDDADWSARWIGVAEGQRPGKGRRPAYWLRTAFDAPAVHSGPGCTSPPSACTRRSWTGGASATSSSRPATPSTARGCSTRRTTSRRWCRRDGTCSRCCWPTAGTAARSGCRGPRTSTATSSRCARSLRCEPTAAGGWRRAAGRAGARRRPTSPRPT